MFCPTKYLDILRYIGILSETSAWLQHVVAELATNDRKKVAEHILDRIKKNVSICSNGNQIFVWAHISFIFSTNWLGLMLLGLPANTTNGRLINNHVLVSGTISFLSFYLLIVDHFTSSDKYFYMLMTRINKSIICKTLGTTCSIGRRDEDIPLNNYLILDRESVAFQLVTLGIIYIYIFVNPLHTATLFRYMDHILKLFG